MSETGDAFAAGWRFHNAGDLPRAEQAYRQALRSEPGRAETWYLLGRVCQDLGRLDEAEASHRGALRLNPSLAEAHNNLGIVLKRQGRPDEAADCYRQALRLRPDYAEAHNNLGNVLKEQSRFDEAVACFRRTVELNPGFAAAYTNLGLVLNEQKKWDEAAACHREALRLRPDFAEVYSNLGLTLWGQGKLDEAIASYREALRLRPDFAEAHSNLGLALADRGFLEEAVASHRQALRIKPEYPEGLINLGNTLTEQGHPLDAIACYDEVLRLRPGHSEAHFNRALARLLTGDFERGWREYELRLECPKVSRPTFSGPRWDGSPLEGRALLLLAEQGLGDTLQFIRFAPRIERGGGTVMLACPRPLLRLLGRCRGLDRVVAQDDPTPPSDVQASVMSLPYLLGIPPDALAAPAPYLFGDPELEERRRLELGAFAGLKIGIAWQGNPDHRRDRRRSFPLWRFEPLARVPGVALFSLQRGAGRDQLREVSGRWPVVDLGGRLEDAGGDFLDTAAVLKALDLVIACDTAIVHLAGGLGVPAWVALPFAPDWRWLLGRADSPWYPTLRLFRQARPDDWGEVFRRMAEALQEGRGSL